MLFLQGTRDAFAQPELLADVVSRLGDRATLESIEGGDHSFRVRGHKRGGAVKDDRAIGAALAGAAAPFVRRVAGAG
jgi:predicted alpha/beta-hydrolase family hydrolase